MAIANINVGADNRADRPGLADRLRERLAQWREYRRTLSELRALDERTLRDLGMSRFEIRRIAYESAYGRM